MVIFIVSFYQRCFNNDHTFIWSVDPTFNANAEIGFGDLDDRGPLRMVRDRGEIKIYIFEVESSVNKPSRRSRSGVNQQSEGARHESGGSSHDNILLHPVDDGYYVRLVHKSFK
ncbi:hypothetical protein M5689_018693 [Euphorbia peplus]|nr:hypothetical protein M5689_018693 [Euphorbia peplus]